MKYDFLRDYNKRMEIVAITEFMTTRISRKLKLREFGFDSNQSINLIMLVLCFIMEKSLVEEVCSKDDIANYIRNLDIDYFNKNIADESYIDIADFTIKDCLQNSGLPHYFETYNFFSQQKENIHIKLIDDKRVEYKGEYIYSYYMTPQGYKFMFNTLEIEESLKVSIEQFKLSLSIKKKNFNVARHNIDKLLNLSKTQVQKINYFIKKIKEDISSTGIDEYESLYNQTFMSIDEQNQGYSSLYDLISKTEVSIMENSNNRLDKENLAKEIDNIIYIKTKLKHIINEQTGLLLKQQELQKIYNEAVDNILFIGFENRLNFEEAVVKKLEQNPTLALPTIKLLRPLFKPSLHKKFNLNLAIKPQKVFNSDALSISNNILFDERHINQFESEQALKIKNQNRQYVDILHIIFKHAFLSPTKEISLSELITSAHDEYTKLVPNLKTLTNVLLQLTNLKTIDIFTIQEQTKSTIFNPSEDFDIKYCVLELLNQQTDFKVVQKLYVSMLHKKQVFIPETQDKLIVNHSNENTYGDKNFVSQNIKGLSCPEIFFKVEVK